MRQPENEVFRDYFSNLYHFYEDYLAQWPFLREICGNLEIGRFNLQRYDEGQHFQKTHTERSDLGTLHRFLAWMTYLSDVDDGGATYFKHYDLSIKPKRGNLNLAL